MSTEFQIRALARRRVARQRALADKKRQPLQGLAEAYLRFEEEELRHAKYSGLASWMTTIPLLRLLGSSYTRLPSVPSMPTFAGKGLARKVMVASAVVAIPVAALAWTQSTVALQALDRAIACSATTTLIDEDGQLVGAIPSNDEATCAGDRAMVTAPFSPETTERLGVAVAAIEGEFSVDSPYVWLGHDIRGFARKAGEVVGLLPGRGFSSPLLTSVEAAMGEHDLTPWRKFVMILTTSRFAAEGLPDDASRARFISMYMPSIIGAGHPRAGLLGAHALLGGEPETPAEFCQLARAMGYAVWAVRDEVTLRAAQSWATSVGPATAACVRAVTETPEAEVAAISDLRAACDGTDFCISPPPLPPGVPESMARRGLDETLIEISRERLPRFSPLSPPGNAQLAALDIMRLGGIEPGGNHATTVDAKLQAALDMLIEPTLDSLDRKLPPDVCLTGQCAHRVDHSVLLGELMPSGNVSIRALHVNRHGALTGWPHLDGQTGVWHAEPPRFGLGSTSKVIVLLAAAQHGITRLCSNAEGGPSCQGGEWMSLRKATALSETESFQWVAAQYPDEIAEIQEQLTAAQGEVVADRAFDAAFGIGRSTMTPIDAVALLAAMLGEGHGTVSFFVDGPALSEIDLGAAGISAAALARAREVLDAPMVDQGGTLISVGEMLRSEGMTPILGKSGTHTEQGVNLVRTSTVAFATTDGRIYILHVSLTASDTTEGLGRVSHDDLVRIQRAVIDSLNNH